jgi:hypothetical protein
MCLPLPADRSTGVPAIGDRENFQFTASGNRSRASSAIRLPAHR